MAKYTSVNQLKIEQNLYDFITQELLVGLDLNCEKYFNDFERLLDDMSGKNKQLLEVREHLQAQIDQWHQQNKTQPIDKEAYKNFLQEIGYLQDASKDFTLSTSKIDKEIASIAGPQLVVPVNNARYALKAYNARWGSLYDSVYSSDIIVNGSHDEKAQATVEYVMSFIDEIFPLANGTHTNVKQYYIAENALQAVFGDGTATQCLQTRAQYAGYQGEKKDPSAIVLKHNGLHLMLLVDRSHPLGAQSSAGIKDVMIESAITAIMDCEDSVAAVDGEDKALVYRNWLGLVRGDLKEIFSKDGKDIHRGIEGDLEYINSDDKKDFLKTRSLLLVRNVGHLMTTPAILYKDEPIYEGLMDAYISATASLYDVKKKSAFANSTEGSIYIVKPKMHGPDEVAFSVEIFDFVEDCLGLERNTIKIGIMDEERRTSLNLLSCIERAKNRVCFINTGFLDRTGDEIHTSFEYAPAPLKGDFKSTLWISSYEKNNVYSGVKAGLVGKAQIGKGMWAKTEHLKEMMETKYTQLQAGASCAWVPSPTAASLHAMHYFRYTVSQIQQTLSSTTQDYTDDILEVACLEQELSAEQIQNEIENNAQGILGYSVRWINQGIGCSKVPDISGTALMEDRATVRISSQHMANWLHHGIISKEQVQDAFLKMASLVDLQNENDPEYEAMGPDFTSSIAFLAARDLVLLGKNQPSGYTEPILHAYRLEKKKNSTHK